MGFQRFQLAVHRNAHRARRPFDHRLRRMVVGAVQAGELFEPGMEDLLGTGQAIATRLTFLVQTGKLDTGPEFVFKGFGVTRRRVRMRVR